VRCGLSREPGTGQIDPGRPRPSGLRQRLLPLATFGNLRLLISSQAIVAAKLGRWRAVAPSTCTAAALLSAKVRRVDLLNFEATLAIELCALAWLGQSSPVV
jgi:hypothetical protein